MHWRNLFVLLPIFTSASLSHAAEEGIPFPGALDAAGIVQEELNDPVRASALIGNGDITGLIFTRKGTITLHISKNDVWDARIDTSGDPELLKINVKDNAISGPFSGPGSWNKPYPAPWICGKLVFDVKSTDTNQLRVSSRLDIRRAVTQVELQNTDNTQTTATVRALAQENAILIQSDAPVRLMPNTARHIPAAQKESEKNAEWMVQELPPDEDWPGMSYAIALVRNGKRHAVAIVTSFESKTPVESARALAQRILKSSDQETIEAHEQEWQTFWSASGVAMDDADLQNMWYQNLYFLRCVSKSGVKAVGLFAGSGKNTYMWHGSHTLNYNSQQTFWGGFAPNHVELADPFIQMIHRYLPRAQWFANQVYGFDGAHFPHNIFTHEPPDPEKCSSRNRHMHAFPPYAYTVGVSGHIIHILWSRYLYSPDREYLKHTAYPVIREVARFYVNYVENCKINSAGKIVLGPSYSPEHWGLNKPSRNHNCTYDIALIQLTLKAAIEGATVLGRDETLIVRCKEALKKLPDYPTTQGENPVVVDVEGAPPINYNITVPTVPVFPADQVTWFSPESQKELFTRTIENIRWNGNNSMVLLAVARARLSMPKTASWLKGELLARRFGNGTIALNHRGAGFNGAGIYTEQFASSAAISELLLQSVDNIIRVFPAWPNDKDASFSRLRAQGGFLVTAEQRGGKTTRLEITSTVGGKLRLLSPWPTTTARTHSREQILQADARGVVEIETTAGETLAFLAD